MGELDCTTSVIQIEEALSPPSASCEQDFDSPRLQAGFPSRSVWLAASAVLAFAPTVTGQFAIPRWVVWPTRSNMILEDAGTEVRRSISLAQARRIAQELQNRIDRDYEKAAELDAKVKAVWEEDK
jgi:hypothetical protein